MDRDILGLFMQYLKNVDVSNLIAYAVCISSSSVV